MSPPIFRGDGGELAQNMELTTRWVQPALQQLFSHLCFDGANRTQAGSMLDYARHCGCTAIAPETALRDRSRVEMSKLRSSVPCPK
jgi:hypothetical protein